jgi:hypothetical protein
MASTETMNEPTRTPAANGASALIHLEGVTKVFLTDEVETHALSGIHLGYPNRRVRLHCRALRLWQVDSPLDSWSARHSFRRKLFPEGD